MTPQSVSRDSVGLIETALGVFTAHYSPSGLVSLSFPKNAPDRCPGREGLDPKFERWHLLTTHAMRSVLSGREPGELPPFDLSAGTTFQQSVWHALRQIPLGQTRSYGEIADAIGNHKALRAVGGACGANPIPVLIPCHRVLAARHQIGGFSGGLDWKYLLLEREGVLLPTSQSA